MMACVKEDEYATSLRKTYGYRNFELKVSSKLCKVGIRASRSPSRASSSIAAFCFLSLLSDTPASWKALLVEELAGQPSTGGSRRF